MGKLSPLVFFLLPIVPVAAQKAAQDSNRLPQWLTGIIAVSCFLLLTFIGLLVKKILCEKSNRRSGSVDLTRQTERVTENEYDGSLDAIRRRRSSGEVRGNETQEEYDISLRDLRAGGSAMSREEETDSSQEYDTSMGALSAASRETETDRDETYDTSMDAFRGKGRHAYINRAMETNED